MADQTALRIEVESTSTAAAPEGGKGNFFGEGVPALSRFNEAVKQGGITDQRQLEELAAMFGIGDFIKARAGKGPVQPALSPSEARRKVAAENRQERDENFVDRQEAKAQRLREAEQQRAKDRQERNENFVDRQEAKRQKIEQSELQKAHQKQQREDERQKREQDSRDPKALAQRMADSYKLREATRLEFEKLVQSGKMGPVTQALVSGASSGAGQIAQRYGGSGAAAAARVGVAAIGRTVAAHLPLIVALGSMAVAVIATTKAFSWSKNKLLEEADNVQRYSPVLQMQRAINDLRRLRTDVQIGQEHGEQMAKVKDRESRMENAWRILSTRIAAFIQNGYGYNLIMDGMTKLMEKLAGTVGEDDKNLAMLHRMVLSIDEMRNNIHGDHMVREMAVALRNGVDVMKALGGDLFSNDTFLTDMFKRIQPDEGQMRFQGRDKEINLVNPEPAWLVRN